MNTIYRIAWSASAGKWVAAPEPAKNTTKDMGSPASNHRRLIPLAVSLLLLGAVSTRQAVADTIAFPTHSTVDIGGGTRTIDGLTVNNNVTGSLVGDGGTLVYNGGNFALGGTASVTQQTLNMSGLSNFVFDSPTASFSVGGRASGGSANTTGITSGTLTLASGNNAITASSFGIGAVNRSVQGPATNQGTVRLGQANTINADRIVIGVNQTTGLLNFQDGISGGTVKIRGTDGVGAVNSWDLAVSSNSNYSASVGTADFSAGTLDAKVETLTIANSTFGSNPAVGTFTLGAGMLDANTIVMGQRSSTSGAGSTQARLNIGAGGTVRANTITMATRTGTTGSVASTINLNGGALRAGSILAGSGAGTTRTINFNNGVLGNYADGEDMAVNVPIALAATGTHTFQVDGADALMTVDGLVSGTNGTLNKAGNGILALTGSNTYSGGTTVNEGLVRFQAGANLGTGSISLDGGGLQWAAGNTLDISSRFTALGRNGAVVDTNGNNISLASAMTGEGGQLVKQGAGTLTLTGDNSFTGATSVLAGALAIDGSIQSDTTVASGAALSGTGVIQGNVRNEGTVWAGHAVAGDTGYGTLTIKGDYVGNNGLLALNTYLGDDDSPSSKLLIDGGNASGKTSVIVHNTRGTQGTTSRDGILVVATANGGTTDANAFALGNYARDGALSYRLFRGDLAGNAPDNWYLRNQFIVPPDPVDPTPTDPVIPGPTDPGDTGSPEVGTPPSPDPVAPVKPDPSDVGPPAPVLPTDPPKPELKPGPHPITGPELATYGVVQPIARELGMLTLGTMQQRAGDSAGTAPALDGNSSRPAVWMRAFASNIDNTYRAFAAPHARGDLSGLQFGADLWQGESNDGRSDRFGGYLAHSQANISVRGLVTNEAATNYVMRHTGSVNLQANSAGAYWTHYGRQGWYLDGVVQASSYRGNASTATSRLDPRGVGLMGSLEFGYPFAMPQLGASFVLEPQVQAIWQRVNFNGDKDGEGAVALGTTTGTTGRVGLRGKWQIDSSRGSRWEPYVALNYSHDWGARSTTTYAGSDRAPLLSAASRLEASGGLTTQLTRNLGIYGAVGYQIGVGATKDARRDGVAGNVGLRYNW